VLDFSKPVALISVLHLIPDEDDPHAIVARLMEAVPSGSWLALSHPARDVHTQQVTEAASRFNQLAPAKATLRTGPRSCASSTAWNSWSPAWSKSTGGGPVSPPPGTTGRQLATAVLPVRPDPPATATAVATTQQRPGGGGPWQ